MFCGTGFTGCRARHPIQPTLYAAPQTAHCLGSTIFRQCYTSERTLGRSRTRHEGSGATGMNRTYSIKKNLGGTRLRHTKITKALRCFKQFWCRFKNGPSNGIDRKRTDPRRILCLQTVYPLPWATAFGHVLLNKHSERFQTFMATPALFCYSWMDKKSFLPILCPSRFCVRSSKRIWRRWRVGLEHLGAVLGAHPTPLPKFISERIWTFLRSDGLDCICMYMWRSLKLILCLEAWLFLSWMPFLYVFFGCCIVACLLLNDWLFLAKTPRTPGTKRALPQRSLWPQRQKLEHRVVLTRKI